ncbi:hypothetical protein, partial [Gemmobacter sp.]|uniref:HTH-like domain-containing protein n=1 Tax=Gemmobacter sp. TaxID=1898957 RepID=UPI0025C16A76
LARIFKERYHTAPKGAAVISIHLFGIEFAEELAGQPLKEICLRAGVPVSYGTEIFKGMRLSQFVSLKP